MPHRPIIFLRGQSVPQCDHNIDKRFDGYYTLQYMSGGAVDLRIDDERYLMEDRWFWSCWPGPRIGFQPARGYRTWVHRYLCFRGDLVKHWQRDRLFPIRPQRPPKGLEYGARIDELLALSRRDDDWGIRRAVNLLEGILIELAEARVTGAVSQPWLDEVIRRLHDSVNPDPPDYQRMAEQHGMSIATFRRKFRRATGLAPHEYLLQCRINSAKQLLAETQLPIKEIARRLGYTDVFFFTRQFKHTAGIPPAMYRQSCQG